MKKLLFTAVTWSYSCAALAGALPFYRETEHFKTFCESSDQKVGDLILAQHETNIKQLEIDFQHTLCSACNADKKITLKMYPNVEAFHVAIGAPHAPNWLVAQTNANEKTSRFVSPNNPGTHHTYDNLMHLSNVRLVTLFLQETSDYTKIPQWLAIGTAFYKSNYYSPKALAWLMQHQTEIPTLEQLDAVSANTGAEQFNAIHGYQCAYWLVKFLHEKYGWSTVKALLSDYKNFESIVGMSKKEFMKQWLEFLTQQYAAQKQS